MSVTYGGIKMAWGKNGTPDTLGSAGDTLTISDLTATIFNQFLHHEIGSGAIYPQLGLNNDTGTNYASRRSANGGADTALTSRTYMFEGGAAGTTTNFSITYCIGISTEEKLAIRFTIFQNTAGAANAPAREELVGKWINTSDQITEIDEINGAAGDYDTDSNFSALGTD
jgi:hypothetical protein